jgi:hypothetical protein
MTLIFIVTSDNADSWALRYWLQVSDVEDRMLERELQLGRFDPARLDQLRRDTQDARDGAVKTADGDGIVYPDKLKDPVTRKVRSGRRSGRRLGTSAALTRGKQSAARNSREWVVEEIEDLVCRYIHERRIAEAGLITSTGRRPPAPTS